MINRKAVVIATWIVAGVIVIGAIIAIIIVELNLQKEPPKTTIVSYQPPATSAKDPIRKAEKWCCNIVPTASTPSGSMPTCALFGPVTIEDQCKSDIYSTSAVADCSTIPSSLNCQSFGTNKCTECIEGEGNCIDPDTGKCTWAVNYSSDSGCAGNSVYCNDLI